MHAPCYDCERFQEKLSVFQDRIKWTHTAEDWAHCCDWLLLTDMASGVEGTSTDVRAKISRSSSSHFWRSLKIKIVQEVRSALQKKEKRQTNRYYRKYSTQECIDLDRLTRACWPKSYIHPRTSPFLKYHYSHEFPSKVIGDTTEGEKVPALLSGVLQTTSRNKQHNRPIKTRIKYTLHCK